MIVGNIAGFESMGLVDGPGVRFVVFMQGCPLRCVYCHNPEMWNKNTKRIQMTPQELLEKVKKYKPYFNNGGGVTVSGGEPLLQAEFVTEFFKLCKHEEIHTCLDTSGHGEKCDELLDYCDLVILDIKELNSQKYQNLVGKSDKKFLNFLNLCDKKKIPMWFRQVIVPNYNDSKESVLALKEFADKFETVEKIELLPYHSMAKNKYEQLGIEYKLKNIGDMDKKICKKLEKLLKK